MTKTLRVLGLLLVLSVTAHALVTDTIPKVDTLYPGFPQNTGDGLWGPTGCTTPEDYDCVDDYQTNDGDATRLSAGTTAGDDWVLFRCARWQPHGLVGIDSIYWHALAMKSGGTAGKICFRLHDGDGTVHLFDTTATLVTTTYTEYEGSPPTPGENPSTTDPWTVDSINNLLWGIERTTNASIGQTLRLSQLYMEIFWQQRVRCDTITDQDEILDTYISSDSTLNNFGSVDHLIIGASASGDTCRTLMWLSNEFFTNFQGYIIDSAWMDLRTGSVLLGSEDFGINRGRRGSNPGTGDGTSPSANGASWEWAQHEPGEDQFKWDIPGCDSAETEGGTDIYDHEYDDLETTALLDSTYTFDITAWTNELAGTDWINSLSWNRTQDGNIPIPLRIRQVDEGAADSQITFRSMDHATSAHRPRVRVFAHWKYIDSLWSSSGVFSRPFGVWDTVQNFTREGSGNQGQFFSVSLRSHQGDTNSIGRYHGQGASWGGLEVSTTTNTNDWASGSYISTIWWWPSIYDTLYDNCLGIDQIDTQYIEKVTLEWTIATKAGSTAMDFKLQGPVLERPKPPNQMNTTALQWASVDDTASTFDELTVYESGSDDDTVQWRTDGCLFDSAGVLGDDPGDYQLRIVGGPDTLTKVDLGKYSEGGLTGHATPIRVIGNTYSSGARLSVDITDMFKTGFAAIAKGGGTAVRDLGFGVLMNWTTTGSSRDSINATATNTRYRFTANAVNGTSAAIVVILNTNLDAVCANKQLGGFFGNPGYRRAGDTPGPRRVSAKKGERRIRP